MRHPIFATNGYGDAVTLTPEARGELDLLGSTSVYARLLQAGPGRGASVAGFKCGDIARGDIEDWLTEQNTAQRDRKDPSIFYSRWTFYVALAVLVAVVAGCVFTVIH